jgi:hypothetical protein
MRLPKSLAGRERLAVVFWLYCVVGSSLAISLPFVTAEWLYYRGFPMWGFEAIAVAEVIFVVWAHVSLWMCAFNTRHRSLGYAARIYSVVALIAFFSPIGFYRDAPAIDVDIVTEQ